VPLLLWVGLAGVTLIITWSHLFRPLRALRPTFLGCPLCVGTWVGWGGALVWFLPSTLREMVETFVSGPAIGVVSFFVVVAADRFQLHPKE
jgi:hypothetical protein